MLDRQCALADMRAAVLACRTTGLPVLALVEADSKGENRHRQLAAFLPDHPAVNGGGGRWPRRRSSGRGHAYAAEGRSTCGSAACRPVTEALGGEGGAPALSRQLALLVQQGVRIFDARRCNNPELIRELAQCFRCCLRYPPLEEPDPDCYAVAVEGEKCFFLVTILSTATRSPAPAILADDLIDLEGREHQYCFSRSGGSLRSTDIG